MSGYMTMRLKQREFSGHLRTLRTSKDLVDLTSNDYFGFAQSLDFPPQVKRIGATGSRLLTGHHSFYEQLETQIAHFHRAPECLIFNTGYCANLGLISALGSDEQATFLYDTEIHASIIDGLRLAKARHLPFRHNNLDSLKRRLQSLRPPLYVLVEALYSISGDWAPLEEIATLCDDYGAHLVVDEAHTTGICGPKGAGLVTGLGLEKRVFARIHTFSKALGVQGACVLGSSLLKEYLINFSRPFIYTTALPMPTLLLIQSAYQKLKKEADFHQGRLSELIDYFRNKLEGKSSSPIQPIYTSSAHFLSKQLAERGIDVRPIAPPTVKRGRECLRVVLHSFNDRATIDTLAEVIL